MTKVRRLPDSRETEPRPRVVAFYLPQFHPIPENDAWWGPGFTEWTNVAKARPLYPGHRQPRLPGELGFYDLRLPQARAAQASLAQQFGVTAFCYWHYWFAGRRILERPLQDMLASGEPDMPFCVGWANQTWSGIWHGAPDRVLIEQTYPGPDDDRRHFECLMAAFEDTRYLRVDGKPLLYIFRPSALPDPKAFSDLWRGLAARAGLPGLWLVGETRDRQPPSSFGFDATVVHPFGDAPPTLVRRAARRFLPLPELRSHPHAVRSYFKTPFRDDQLPCVLPEWDNTPRSGRTGLVLTRSSPQLFAAQVRAAIDVVAGRDPAHRIIFLKSWNEWAEGNYMEPDAHHGRSYLEALDDTLSCDPMTHESLGSEAPPCF